MNKETLEEAAEIWVNNRFTKQICGDESYPDIHASKEGIVESHILFTKSQAELFFKDDAKLVEERRFSKEDLISFAFFYFKEEFNSVFEDPKSIEEIFILWFEQFKNK
jgi:hypothetical protein